MLRALGMDWSSFFSKVAPVTVLRGSIAGAPSTVTVSLTAASFIVTRSWVLRSSATTTPWLSTVAKPSSDSVRAYVPGEMYRNRNLPRSSVWTGARSPAPSSFTVAPGSGPPCSSTRVP